MASGTKIESDGTIESFLDWVKADGSTEFQPEAGRYHLYIQHLCPFAHRVTIGIVLKGLENVITVDNVDWDLLDDVAGWKFSPEKDGCDADSVNGCKYLSEIYDFSAKKCGAKGYSGDVTVPVLFDKKLGRIVNNMSAEILRMLNSEFNNFCSTEEQRKIDLYPIPLRDEIEEVEAWTQNHVIFGVYGPRSARSQEAYDQAVNNLYEGLDRAEALLSKQRYLVGNQMTEADVRFFVALIRFDPVFTQYMLSKKRIVDYPSLWGYVRDVYQTASIRSTVHLDHIIKGYFTNYSTKRINPYGIIPALPDLDYDEPTGREKLTAP